MEAARAMMVAPLGATLEPEITGFEELAHGVRAVRGLLAAQHHVQARQACDQLLQLALSLEAQTTQRNEDCDVKPQAGGADELRGQAADAEATRLLAAQEQARQELAVTMDTLGDLRAHTEALLGALLGSGTGLYDEQGRRRRVARG